MAVCEMPPPLQVSECALSNSSRGLEVKMKYFLLQAKLPVVFFGGGGGLVAAFTSQLHFGVRRGGGLTLIFRPFLCYAPL